MLESYDLTLTVFRFFFGGASASCLAVGGLGLRSFVRILVSFVLRVTSLTLFFVLEFPSSCFLWGLGLGDSGLAFSDEAGVVVRLSFRARKAAFFSSWRLDR